MTQRIEPLFLIRLKILNLFFLGEHDSKNWTFLWTWLKDFFEKKLWLKESKLFFYDSRIEPVFSKLWLKELNFLSMTQRIELLECESKNWTFWKYDSQNGTFFWIWVIELHFFFKKKTMTQRNELFLNHSKNWTIKKQSYDSKNWTIF